MITPEAIKKKALKFYPDFLRAVLTRTTFFPLHIKGNKGAANRPLEELYASLKYLLQDAKDRLGYGYVVDLKQVNTRHAGTISMPDAIYFEHIEDYLKYIEKETEFIDFQKNTRQLLKQFPTLKDYLVAHPMALIKYNTVWKSILLVLAHLQQNPRPNVFARALPIAVSARFIEQHQRILQPLLDLILPPSAIDFTSEQFEQRFGFRQKESLIRMRILEEGLVQNLPLNLVDIALPITPFAKLEISAETVFIIEKELPFLSFPEQLKSIALLGEELSARDIRALPFLANKRLFYWGELSCRSFEFLNQLRQYFPAIQSLLMNETTYEVLSDYARPNKEKLKTNLSLLSAQEAACLEILRTTETKLEQEWIPQKMLVACLENA